jgi:hemoglobin
MSLYDDIGQETIERAIREFYRRAFDDGIIGHFFFGKDIDEIATKQIQFASRMLGGPVPYTGRSMTAIHTPFKINKAHFGRRQVLMRQVLEEMQVDPALRDAWLAMEERLKSLIVNC